MAEIEWPLEDLPKVFEVQEFVLVCRHCGRRWRLQPGHSLNVPNWQYLVEHAELHERSHRDRRRPVQAWRSQQSA